MLDSFGVEFDKAVVDWKEECENCDALFTGENVVSIQHTLWQWMSQFSLLSKKNVRDVSQLNELGEDSDADEEGNEHDGMDLDLGATDAASTTSSAASESPTSSVCPSESEDAASDFELEDNLSESEPEATEGDDEQPLATEAAKQQCVVIRGYKFEFDNLDKTIKPRYMTVDSRTKSMHYVQIYSVKDRIDFSSLQSTPTAGMKCLYDVLPSATDYSDLKKAYCRLIANMMVEHIPFFSKNFKGLIPKHPPHQYASEMSEKSEVVSRKIDHACTMHYITTFRFHLGYYRKTRQSMTTCWTYLTTYISTYREGTGRAETIS